MRRVLLAVDASTPDLTPDDRFLAAALERRQVEVRPVRWGSEVPPGAIVVVRSTWDYIDRSDEFVAWLDHLDAQGVPVVNPTPLLRWNLHKQYLLDLQRRGVPIVPTELVRRQGEQPFDEIRARRGWRDVVVKPAIGGTAREAVHSGLIGPDATATHLARLVATEDALVQPAVESIRTDGELSVIVLGGVPITAVRKIAATGEWRVQSEFGGIARTTALTDDLVSIARRCVAAVDDPPIYARVDVARLDGVWVLMELELVEPELFFRLDDRLAERLAELLLLVP